ncbi:MAG TPA: valine--tRNA ligase [Actinomycetota bacterium]|nr:valine--tRNA ligase [Actinomycetota bacterium]
MTELPKAYQPEEIEKRWYEEWERSGAFRADPSTSKKPYVIVLPPPNVTGALHMGHALNHSLQDALIRRARMQGYEALWVPGSDHAGIATQNVVERELRKEGIDRHALGREAFVERVWEWKREYGGRITRQMRELGESCDWERERFTMDEGLSRAVRTVFVRWFEDGLVYRGLRVINWCPRCTTALSDIEVEHEDVAGELVTFRYELTDGSGSISVATTRIETMLGDTGVFVHPDDGRYASLVGKTVRHPFFPDRELPIVADEAVDPEFGTGAVKGTPAHDPVDFEMSERAGTDKVNVFTETAHVNDNGGRFEGMDRYEARGAVLAALDELGLVEKVERPYVHAVGHCYRCGTEIEPWLSEQWFVKMRPLAEPAIEAAKDGRVTFHPPRFAKAYLHWMENLRDWCISRQLWWGHRIPVWYCDACGETIAVLEDPTECRCGSTDLRQDPDVLDTWFSSQLWPFSTLGWPDDTPDLKTFYPTTVMVTAYDIIYLWVARMVMSGMYFVDGLVPFGDVFIHGVVRDGEGKKMSKSLGNVIDPIEMVHRYGADALRFSLAFVTVPGNDSNSSEERVEGARNFANKLWNASRFVLMSLGDERPELGPGAELLVEDRWILSRLDHAIETVSRELDAYNFSEALHALHAFVWSELCDWYVELAKPRLREGGSSTAGGVLVHCLDRVLRLLHPVMPFITEELWSKLYPAAGSIMTAQWPEPEGRRDAGSEETMGRFQDLVVALRRLKIEHEVPQGQRVPVSVAAGDFAPDLESLLDQVVSLARLESVELVDDLGPAGSGPRTITPGGIEAAMRLGGVADPAAERERLERKRDDLQREVERAEGKLANESFVAKAPAAVVDKERAKLDEARAALAKVDGQLTALSG